MEKATVESREKLPAIALQSSKAYEQYKEVGAQLRLVELIPISLTKPPKSLIRPLYHLSIHTISYPCISRAAKGGAWN